MVLLANALPSSAMKIIVWLYFDGQSAMDLQFGATLFHIIARKTPFIVALHEG